MKLLTSAHVDAGAAVTHSVLATARALFAPGAVVHLGAGAGQGLLHQWRQWPVPASLVLDAQPLRMAWAAEWAAQGSDRFVSDALLAGADGQAAQWHAASNPDESGLVPPNALQKFWPQLKGLEPVDTPARSLDALLAEPAHAALLRAPNLWLVVDFFCGPEFWQGASATLAQARVLVLRQAKAAPKGIEPQQDATDRMAALGYVLAATLPSKHPDVVHGVYLRSLDHDFALARQQALQLAAEVQTLTAARDAEARAKNEALAQRGVLAKEKNVLVLARDAEAAGKAEALAQRDALAQEKTALSAARDAEAAARAEAVKQRDALAQEKTALSAARDAEAAAKAEAVKQRDALAQEKAALSAARDAEAQAKVAAVKQRDALAQEKTALSAARDAEAAAKAEAVVQRDALAQEKAALSAARDAEAAAKAEALKQRDALAQEKTTLSAARDAEAAAKAEALKQRDALVQEKTALSAARDAEAAKKAQTLLQLENQNSELKRLALVLNVEVDRRNQTEAERDRLTQFQNYLQHQLAVVGEEIKVVQQRLVMQHKEHSEVITLLQQNYRDSSDQLEEKIKLVTIIENSLSSAQATIEEKEKITQDYILEIKSLSRENELLNIRQQKMQEELLKAEAQIELIKDLMVDRVVRFDEH